MTTTGRLANKVAIVTGSDSGIGRAIAIRFAREGAAVTINYHRNEQNAQAVRQQIEKEGGKATIIQGDVATAADVQKMIEGTVQAFGSLDILVNNAGIEFPHPSFLDVAEKEWDLVIGVNLKGPFLCTQAAVRQMQKGGKGGRIVNISSVHEDIPMPGNSPYCAAKGGLRMLMRTLCDELAPHQITINNIGPGAIATPINTGTLSDPEKVKALNASIPLGRVGQPEEVAGLAVYLASDEAAYVTGASYFIDGGMMRQALGL
ncbi:MAG: SDR family oxidoreductase [Thermomicrobia bacterium]|nr:SDR family oxidoreductase [Thermomicrobia bacterium]MCA1723609.1 SDR family oxidoreductase [Thermomicrobia bacterium]